MVQVSQATRHTPLLENGDRLTRDEFKHRYALMPNVNAERIEGVVYMAATLRYRRHGNPHSYMVTWLGLYAANTLGIEPADNATVHLDIDNDPQPDVLLRLEEAYGGQSSISDDDYIEGAPELFENVTAIWHSRGIRVLERYSL